MALNMHFRFELVFSNVNIGKSNQKYIYIYMCVDNLYIKFMGYFSLFVTMAEGNLMGNILWYFGLV
jgi:hypothetical protein